MTTRIWRMKTELGERLRLNHWMSRGSGAAKEEVSDNQTQKTQETAHRAPSGKRSAEGSEPSERRFAVKVKASGLGDFSLT